MLRQIVLAIVVIVCGSFSLCGWAATPKKSEKPDPAHDAVEKVLRQELVSQVDRRAALKESMERQPDSKLIRWQAGYVRTGDSWRRAEEAGESTLNDATWRRYAETRDQAPETAAGQLALADWCRQNGLPDQERAHLGAVLALAPNEDNSHVLKRLGLTQVGGHWLSGEQIRKWQEMNRRAEAALKRWGPRVEKVAEKLGGTARQHDLAMSELRDLTEPEVIPVIECLLCGRDERCALAGVETFAKIDRSEGTLALARQAVFSKWPAVRDRATEALKKRRLEEFVPPLIGLLASPVTTKVVAQLFFFHGFRDDERRLGTQGQLVLLVSYIMARETDDQFQVAALRTMDYRVNQLVRTVKIGRESYSTGPSKVLTARQQVDQLRSDSVEAYEREKLADSVNEQTEALNRQVIGVLATVAGRDPDQDPAVWWQWWANFTDTQQLGAKPVVTVSEDTAVKGDPTLTLRRASCFAAGTPVWTESGQVAIEKIKIGDRVLAQDIDSGELSYKPVLRTTVRPPRELVRVRIGNETIAATGGHRFWISGEGWTKARDLAPPSLAHTVTGNVPVGSISKGVAEPTYNLVVADFHSYFVGVAGVLVQDLPLPQPTNVVVPGLPRK